MSLLTVPVVLMLAAGPEPLLVAPYQSLGVNQATVTAITEGFRAAIDKAPLTALPAAESEKVARSAVMCGEDGACLATVGQRSGARWVLAFGVGKVGSSLLLSAVFVDVTQGKEVMRGSRRVPEAATDWVLVTRSLAEEVVKPPVAPVVVQVPIEVVKPQHPHTFRPWAFVTLGVAILSGIISTGLGVTALGNYGKLSMASSSTYAGLATTQRGLNAWADSFLIVSALSGGMAIIFFILDRFEKPVVPAEMRRLLVIAAVGSSGCSIFFNPDNVPLKVCDPLPPVAPLEGLVGDRTSITWLWPNAPADAGRFKDWQLCWGPTAGTTDTCTTVPWGSCDAGQCAFKLDGPDAGLAYNTRVHAKVSARDQCGGETAPARTSTTPLNGTFLNLDGISNASSCDAGLHADGGGTLVFEHAAGLGPCISLAVMGDDAWRDLTMDLELRVAGDGIGGVMFRAVPGSNTQRNAAMVNASLGGQATVYVTQRQTMEDAPAATSGIAVPQNGWRSMRVSVVDAYVSVALGADVADLREVIRWRDGSSTITGGQLGLAIASTFFVPAQLEVRNLRVRSGAQTPDGGLTRDVWTFSGPTAQHALRLVGAGLMPCPVGFDAGCATCAPDAGSQCLRVQAGTQATVDVPVGINFGKPWTVRFKFAPDTTGVMANPSILRTTQPPPMKLAGENVFSGMPIIDVEGNGWVAAPRMFRETSQPIGPPLTPGRWTSFEVTFDGNDSTYAVKRDGAPVQNGSFRNELTHLGALVLGGGGNYQGYFTNLGIVQPPP